VRHDALFLVKRWASLIGRPDSSRRLTVAYQAYTLATAQRWAADERQRALDVWSRRRAVLWIERRGQPATRPRKARAA
jgi:hypothetical protein